MIAFFSRVAGFLLLFVGTLVVVVAASIWGGCATGTSCDANWASGVLNAIVTGKILWALGLLALGGGAGIKLHWGLPRPTEGKPEEFRYVTFERLANYAVLLVCVLLLAVLLLTVNSWPPTFTSGLP